MLNRISIGWVWLERTFNRIIDEVNQQKPIASSTIAVEESPNGTLLKVVATQANQPAGSSGAATKPPAPAPVIWHNVAWQQVTVVDPVTCGQSTITVLVQKPENNIRIQ